MKRNIFNTSEKLQIIQILCMISFSVLFGIFITQIGEDTRKIMHEVEAANTSYEVFVAEYLDKEVVTFSIPSSAKSKEEAVKDFNRQCILNCTDYGCPDSVWITLTENTPKTTKVLLDTLIYEAR